MSQPSRLTRFVGLPGGLAASQALAQAAVNLESHREAALEVIDQALGELSQNGSQASHAALSRLSDSIGGLAGMFEMESLSQTAKRLGDIVRMLDARGVSGPDLIDLHIAALRIVRVQPDPQGAAELLNGLDQIAARQARGAGSASA